MKKIIKCLLLLIFIVPIKVFAYGIDNYMMDIDILDNGDILVEEYFKLNGEYNGFERILEYENKNCLKWNPNDNVYSGSCIHNGSGLIMKEIREVNYNSNFDFNNITGTLYEEVSSASKGDSGVYTNSGSSYMIYHPSNLKKAFYLKYIVEDVGIVHNDVGEFGFNVIGNYLKESINNFKVIIHIPNNKNIIKAWAHGPQNGNVNIIDNETVAVTISGLKENTPIDVRLVFDKSVISNSKKLTNINALEKIISYENECKNFGENFYEKEIALNSLINLEKMNINEIDYKTYYDSYQKIVQIDDIDFKNKLLNRLEIQKNRVLSKEKEFEIRNYILCFIEIILLIGILYYIYIKFDKEYKSNFNAKYFRDLPDNLSITDVSYLLYHKISKNSFSAIIMDLVRKKVLKLEKDPNDDKNYFFYKIDNNSTLTDIENKALDLLMCGKEKSSLYEMRSYAKNNYSYFLYNYNSFFDISLDNAISKKFYINDGLVKRKTKQTTTAIVILLIVILCVIPFPIVFFIFGIIFLFKSFNNKGKNDYLYKRNLLASVLFLIFSYNMILFFSVLINNHYYIYSTFFLILVNIFLILLLIYLFKSIKRTRCGNEEYMKWNAFRNFLNDFGLFKEKDLPEVYLWDIYLVYATLFGCAKNIYDKMRLNINNYDSSYLYDYCNIENAVNDSINSSFIIANNANSSNSSSGDSSSSSSSSSSGSGGSFSSGGGSFGGGGGGGRF